MRQGDSVGFLFTAGRGGPRRAVATAPRRRDPDLQRRRATRAGWTAARATELLLGAVLEPDVDGDGLGDESQDPDGGGLGMDWEDDWFDDYDDGDELDEDPFDRRRCPCGGGRCGC